MKSKTYYRICSRLHTANISAGALDTLLTTRHPATFEGALVTLRGDLCDNQTTAEMHLRSAKTEFPHADHWLQTIRFDQAAQPIQH